MCLQPSTLLVSTTSSILLYSNILYKKPQNRAIIIYLFTIYLCYNCIEQYIPINIMIHCTNNNYIGNIEYINTQLNYEFSPDNIKKCPINNT